MAKRIVELANLKQACLTTEVALAEVEVATAAELHGTQNSIFFAHVAIRIVTIST